MNTEKNLAPSAIEIAALPIKFLDGTTIALLIALLYLSCKMFVVKRAA
jgi:hypothetical protein